MLVGVFDKMAKVKRQQQNMPPQPPEPYDDFGEVEEQPSPPQTLEEIMRRMMQTVETPKKEEALFANKEAQSLDFFSNTPYYQPVVSQITDPTEKAAPSGTEKETSEYQEFEFDIRQAVISSEILNRKY